MDYVIVFTALREGPRTALAAAPLLLLPQVQLLPAYLWIMIGPDFVDTVDSWESQTRWPAAE